MNKQSGYKIYAAFYRLFCLFPVRDRQVFLVMTHDASKEGNVGVVETYMKNLHKGYQFARLIRTDTYFTFEEPGNIHKSKVGKIIHALKKAFHFFIMDAYKMATSRYIFLDNMFLPMAYMKFRKNVRVVQLWHGTGTLKKLGQDVNEGQLKELEYRANQVTTDLIASGDKIAGIYQQSFAMPPEKIHVTGMPRTDILFNRGQQDKLLADFYQEYPACRGKKLILYAPTFRDQEKEHPRLMLDAKALQERLGENVVIGLRMHPFVARNIQIEASDGVVDFSSYPSLNTLLCAADVLITDYSSIFFEYVTFDRPIIFYAYDLQEFIGDGRGFYEDYQSFVPGEIALTEEEVFVALQKEDTFSDRRREFVVETYRYQDGKSMERLASLLEL